MKKINTNKVIDILNVNIKNAEITRDKLDQSLIELGMESLTFIQIIVAIEEEFECEIPDSKLLITEMDTVEKIMNVLQTLYDESTT